MFRRFAIAAVLGAMAFPAAAATVKVDVTGLDSAAAHAKIVDGAMLACRIEMRGSSTFEQFYLHEDCINQAVADAEAKLASANRLARR